VNTSDSSSFRPSADTLWAIRTGCGHSLIESGGQPRAVIQKLRRAFWVDRSNPVADAAVSVGSAGISMKSETERDRWHGMKALWRFGATAVLVSSAPLAVLVNNSTPAAANIVYDWQGTCTLGCSPDACCG
jgi:hypothetical protein